MILKLDKNRWNELIPLLKENILENYFNILGLVSEKNVYKDIYVQYSKTGEINSILLLRNSGTIKFYARKSFDSYQIADFLKTVDYKALIGPVKYCKLIQSSDLFTKSNKLTELCHLKSKIDIELDYINGITPIGIEDLDKVIEVYEKSFESFASENVLRGRIENKRGRSFGIFDGNKLASVAFTDFESVEDSLIVGVATIPECRNRGYGTKLVKYLSILLQNEKKQVYLEYENRIAGDIYRKLGFCIVDSVYKYWD